MSNYIKLHRQGELEKIRDILIVRLANCTFCPRNCGVNRLEGEVGFCHTGRKARVSSSFLHFGEEPELVGKAGSGTIFFSFCNLGCLYCQNDTLSHLGEGEEFSPQNLAETMLMLQDRGAHNINFVTPTHVIAQILEGLCIAVDRGLHLPLVYNCGGYESTEVLKLVRGIFDIYMPDIKYSDNEIARKFSCAPDYWEIVKSAVIEMHQQVGDLIVEDGIAKRGLLIRHLVLPNGLAGSFEAFKFIKEEVSHGTYVNIMQQYRPCYKAAEFDELSRRISSDEFMQAIGYARKMGFYRGF